MIKAGTIVQWLDKDGLAKGQVLETYSSEVQKKLDGIDLTLYARDANKALLIQLGNGHQLFKFEQEVHTV